MSLKGNVAVCDGVGLLLDTCCSLCLDDCQRACLSFKHNLSGLRYTDGIDFEQQNSNYQ